MRLWYIGLGLCALCLIGLLIGFVVTRADDAATAERTGTLGTTDDTLSMSLLYRPCDSITDSRRGEVEGRFPIKCFHDPAYYYPLVEQKCDTFKYEDVTCIWCHPDTTWHRKVAVWMTPDEWLIWKTIKEKR